MYYTNQIKSNQRNVQNIYVLDKVMSQFHDFWQVLQPICLFSVAAAATAMSQLRNKNNISGKQRQ